VAKTYGLASVLESSLFIIIAAVLS